LIGLNSINKKLLNNKCILFDCDTFYHVNIIDIYREQKENAIFCFKDIQDKPIFSYVTFDEEKIIIDIKEKIKISDYANTGCYCFKNGSLLKEYCEKIIDKNIREKNEFYTSCVIKEMLQDGHKFISNIINYSEFSCVGTPMQLKIYCSNFINKSDKKRFCFSLDNTLFTEPLIKHNYLTVKPIIKNIEYLKFLKNLGNYIIIYTSRGMDIHNGNIGLAMKDISKITYETLEKYEIPYDEIYFGKPYADFYIDNNSVSSYDDLEKKLGFYKTTIKERDFNEITEEKMDIIMKKSNNDKIKGEIFYYKNIPHQIKKYFPIFINNGDDWYSMEKINGITLSYLYVNESLSEDIFIKYLSIMYEIHNINNIDKTHNIDKTYNIDQIYKNKEIPCEINIYDNYINKLKNRYENYDYSSFENNQYIYNTLIKYFIKYENDNKGIYGVIHGDAVFSNCIIDQNNNFKFIDMRGKINKTHTIYGDILYDYAKIYQSLIGYDEILLDKILPNDYKSNFINIFVSFVKKNIGDEYVDIIKMITNNLLFTLIPLHKNEKCNDYYKLINL
jgi:capsule biosynthesis phosphatase